VRAAKAAFQALELAEGPPGVFALPLFPKEADPPGPGGVTPTEASPKVTRRAVQHPTGVQRAATRKERLGSNAGRKAADSGRKASASAKKAVNPGKKAAGSGKRAADPGKKVADPGERPVTAPRTENACPRCRAPTWKRTASRPNRTFGRSGVYDQTYVCVDCGFAEIHTVQLA
jgi:hypothetical protein